MLLSRIIFIICIFFSTSSYTFAENKSDSLTEDIAQEIYYETLSPFCPGRALADCPTEQARDLKLQMFNDLKAGKSKQQIIEEFLNKYGKNFSSTPDMSGINLAAWILPIIVVAIGLVIVFFKLFTAQKS